MKKYIFTALILATLVAVPVFAQSIDTSALIARLQAIIVQLTEQLNQLIANQEREREQNRDSFCWDFSRDIKFGDGIGYQGSSDVVLSLHQSLKAEGIEVDPSEAVGLGAMFKESTLNAVKKFQTKYGIPNTGYVGPLTRAKLNQLYGCKKVFITPNALANAKVGEYYYAPNGIRDGHQVTAHSLKGDVKWSVINGQLPVGMFFEELIEICPAVACEPGKPCCTSEESYKAFFSGTPTTAGTYTFTIQATNGTQTATQTYTLRVLAKDDNSQAPVISGVSGPTSLQVGQEGEWKVNVQATEGQTLSYFVIWGDEGSVSGTEAYGCHDDGSGHTICIDPPPPPPGRQTGIFTHAYNIAGTYTPVFTVTNQSGQSAKTSLSVKVGDTTQSPITVTSPNGGEVWEIGKPHTIVLSKGISANFPTTPAVNVYLLDQGNNFAGMITCIKNADNQTRIDWSGLNLMNFCGAGYGKERAVVPGQYKIRLSLGNPEQTLITESDYFKIMDNQSPITLTSPNGGEVWLAGSTGNITWNWPEAKRTDKVDIYLDQYRVPCAPGYPCLQGELMPFVLDKNISARASYNWVVATEMDRYDITIPTGQYRLRVCQAGTNVCDSSDQPFSIVITASTTTE